MKWEPQCVETGQKEDSQTHLTQIWLNLAPETRTLPETVPGVGEQGEHPSADSTPEVNFNN